MAGFVSFSGVAGAGSCATQFAANSFPASSGIVTKDLLLPAAAAAKVGVVHCSLNRTYSSTEAATGRGGKIFLSANSFPASSGVRGAQSPLVAERTKHLLLPAAAAKVGVVHCSSNRTHSSTEAVTRGGKMSLSVPEGTKITRGFLPVANRNNQITRSSTNPSAVTFDEEFGHLFEEIPLKMNCVALVGQEDILEDSSHRLTPGQFLFRRRRTR